MHDFPDKNFALKCFTHDLAALIGVAKLQPELDSDTKPAGNALGTNWGIARRWTEQSRYEQKTEAEAKGLYDAVTDNTNGMMQWIKTRY